MSQETSYDVYVKNDIDKLGRDEFGTAVAHFIERENAVALKRRLEARGEKVRVERSTVYGLSEEEKETWYSDYYRIPEFDPAWGQFRPENPALTQKTSGDEPVDTVWAPPSLRPSAQRASEGRRGPWWRRIAGGQ